MRPKKSILLYCANEAYASQMRFKLDVWAYDVESASNEDELREAFAGRAFDLVLFVPVTRGERALIEEMQQLQIHAGESLRVIDRFGVFAEDKTVSFNCLPHGASLMREQIAVAVSRKRGPRKAVLGEMGAKKFEAMA